MPQCKISVSSLGPAAADKFSYLVNHLQGSVEVTYRLFVNSQTRFIAFGAFGGRVSMFSHHYSLKLWQRGAGGMMNENILPSCPTWVIGLSVDNLICRLLALRQNPSAQANKRGTADGISRGGDGGGSLGGWRPPPLLGKKDTWRETSALVPICEKWKL